MGNIVETDIKCISLVAAIGERGWCLYMYRIIFYKKGGRLMWKKDRRMFPGVGSFANTFGIAHNVAAEHSIPFFEGVLHNKRPTPEELRILAEFNANNCESVSLLVAERIAQGSDPV